MGSVVQNRCNQRPPKAIRLISRWISWYLRASPIAKGKHTIWRAGARHFLVAETHDGLCMRTSGLTDGEKSLFLKGTKEARSLEFATRFLEPGMVAFDVGANIGYFTLAFAASVGESGHVHAFEPTPALAERIRLNAALNCLTQITVNQIAIAEGPGTATLHLSFEDPEANSLYQIEIGTTTVPVTKAALDTYVTDARVDRVDLMKVDCEGSELNVLRGATRILTGGDAPVLLVECNPASLSACGATVKDLYEQFRAASYDCYCLEELRTGDHPVWNLLALKGSHLKALQLAREFGLTEFRA